MSTDFDFDPDYQFGEEFDFVKSSLSPFVRKFSENLNSDDTENSQQAALRKTSCCDPADFKVKFKTEICKYWRQTGSCPFEVQCAFAHGTTEIRNKTHLPNNYKTKKCKKFFEQGHCQYGNRCQFLHDLTPQTQPQQQKQESPNQQKSKKNSENAYNNLNGGNILSDQSLNSQNSFGQQLQYQYSQGLPKSQFSQQKLSQKKKQSNLLSKNDITNISHSPIKYQTQLEDIDQYWDSKSMCFSSPKLQCMRPRLVTFELLTNTNSPQQHAEKSDSIWQIQDDENLKNLNANYVKNSHQQSQSEFMMMHESVEELVL